jgi:hypothetical protein
MRSELCVAWEISARDPLPIGLDRDGCYGELARLQDHGTGGMAPLATPCASAVHTAHVRAGVMVSDARWAIPVAYVVRAAV